MRALSRTTALVAGIIAGTIGLATPAISQSPATTSDSAHRFALFAGPAPAAAGRGADGFALGGSGDFRWSPIPVPLRLSLSFDERESDYTSTQRGAQAALDLVLRPIPKWLGVQPYFLGGVGVATRAGYYGVAYRYVNAPEGIVNVGYPYSWPRQTWAFASAGMGLDVGRLFMQLKFERPVASQGPTMTPLTIGFRFWDE